MAKSTAFKDQVQKAQYIMVPHFNIVANCITKGTKSMMPNTTVHLIELQQSGDLNWTLAVPDINPNPKVQHPNSYRYELGQFPTYDWSTNVAVAHSFLAEDMPPGMWDMIRHDRSDARVSCAGVNLVTPYHNYFVSNHPGGVNISMQAFGAPSTTLAPVEDEDKNRIWVQQIHSIHPEGTKHIRFDTCVEFAKKLPPDS